MSNFQTPLITTSGRKANVVHVDLVVVPVFGKDDLDNSSELKDLDACTGGSVGRARVSREFSGQRRETFVANLSDDRWMARRVAFVGVGPKVHMSERSYSEDTLHGCLRESAAVGARLARRLKVATMAFLCRYDKKHNQVSKLLAGSASCRQEVKYLGKAVAEGLGVGGFLDRRYKNDNDDNGPTECEILWSGRYQENAAKSVERGYLLACATNSARELANAPANLMTPTVFSETALDLGRAAGLTTTVLEEPEIQKLGMNLLLGVARGSEQPPKMVIMQYSPPELRTKSFLALVGKGVTFDSGGISIKPATGMESMKKDMAGGSAVIGAMCALGALGCSRRVVGIVPMTENMPSGTATKPGDILTGAGGTTVEVINTDAEGRLILADALWYARQLGATHLVDVATLTGACVVALGKVSSGLFARPRVWSDALEFSAKRAGEYVWSLPLYDDYREQLRSEMADLKNTGGRFAGAGTAAAFLETFTGGLPWAHIDIAGTAWLDEDSDCAAPGATGVMVRTLTELALGDWNC